VPLALGDQARLRFESLLAELSAKFVNFAASEVDLQTESALRRMIEFLAVDRGRVYVSALPQPPDSDCRHLPPAS
jgi:hypothetical protein